MRFINIAFAGLLMAVTTTVAAPLGATKDVVARDALDFTPPMERRGGVYYKPWKAYKPEKPDHDKPHYDKPYHDKDKDDHWDHDDKKKKKWGY